MVKRILFTGGGSAGHVTPNIALIETLREEGWEVRYVGSERGIEHNIMQDMGVPFSSIATGKLRRYFDWQNFTDPFRIIWGFLQSLVICLRYRPHIVFSKGGFVAVPLVVAAWLCRIPVIAHESDTTPGLANRLCYPFVRWICVNFPEAAEHLPAAKVIVTGSPVRKALLAGDPSRGRDYLGTGQDVSILLVFGGSLGAATLNRVVREALPALCERFVVVHVTGGGAIDPALSARAGYLQFEYLSREFGDVLAAADVVLSRAGANSVYELLVMRKPHLLIPLPLSASRGDQIENARVFEQAGMSRVLPQEQLDAASLIERLDEVVRDTATISNNLQQFQRLDSVTLITDLIRRTAH